MIARKLAELLWEQMDKPPWVTIRFESHSLDHVVYCFIDNTRTRRREVVKLEERYVWKITDRDSQGYVADALYKGLHEVTRDTVAAAVGTLYVYRDD